MKKFISLLLCVAMCCILLVGCVDEPIGSDLEDYEQYRKQDDRSPIELDFYIVSDTTDLSAKETVAREINAYLFALYETTLDIHFLTSDEYLAKLHEGVNATGADRADIVLITGKAMFDELYGAGKLVSLNRYFSSKDFGRLNSPEMIASALLQASVAPDGNKYVVPNNRVVGEYGYYLVNKEVARYFYVSELDFKQMRYDPAVVPATYGNLMSYFAGVSTNIAKLSADIISLESDIAAYLELTPDLSDAISAPNDFNELEAALAAISADINGVKGPDGNETAAGKLQTAIKGVNDALKVNTDQESDGYKALKALKDRYDAAKALCSEYSSGYSTNKASYDAYVLTEEYAAFEVDNIAHAKYVNFRASFEQLVSDNRDALITAGLDPDTAYLTHNEIGTDYSDRLAYLDEYTCISGLPYVTVEEAHESSFAIIAQDGTEEANNNHAFRCMEVIYSLGTDSTLKNLLQYGVRNTHYVEEEIYVDEAGNVIEADDDGKFIVGDKTFKIDTDGKIYELSAEGEIPEGAESVGKAIKVIRVSTLDGAYRMNMLYTGSVFNAHYNDYAANDANVWSALLANSGKIQNKEAQVK